MIGYTTLGTNDLPKAIVYYDALLGDLGASQIANDGRIVLWTKAAGEPMLAVCTPYDGKPATVGNGVMVALNVGTKELVHQIYTKALELGSPSEGEPGPRGDNDILYGGYFRDLDGNKLFAFCFSG